MDKEKIISRNNYFIDFLNEAVSDLDVMDNTSLVKALQKINALIFSEYCMNRQADPDDKKELRIYARIYTDIVAAGLCDFISTEDPFNVGDTI